MLVLSGGWLLIGNAMLYKVMNAVQRVIVLEGMCSLKSVFTRCPRSVFSIEYPRYASARCSGKCICKVK